MDLTARVTALEEEVSLLKGEIKMILSEVRTAVLSRDNPFAAGGLDVAVPVAVTQLAAVPSLPIPPPVEPAPTPTSNGHSSDLHEPEAIQSWPEKRPEPYYSERPQFRDSQEKETLPAAVETDRPHRWSVHSLAALMSWTQESAQRFSKDDLGIVLSLACYGGLIDTELEATLGRLAEVLAPEEKPRQATSNDFLLGLRQLDALLDEAKEPNHTDYPARRAS